MTQVMMILLWIQALTMVALGLYFLFAGDNWRLGTAQILLAAVTIIVYSGGL